MNRTLRGMFFEGVLEDDVIKRLLTEIVKAGAEQGLTSGVILPPLKQALQEAIAENNAETEALRYQTKILREEVDRLKREISTGQSDDLKKVESLNRVLDSKRQTLEQETRTLKAERSLLVEQVNVLTSENAGLHSTISTLDQEIEDLKTRFGAELEKAAAILKILGADVAVSPEFPEPVVADPKVVIRRKKALVTNLRSEFKTETAPSRSQTAFPAKVIGHIDLKKDPSTESITIQEESEQVGDSLTASERKRLKKLRKSQPAKIIGHIDLKKDFSKGYVPTDFERSLSKNDAPTVDPEPCRKEPGRNQIARIAEIARNLGCKVAVSRRGESVSFKKGKVSTSLAVTKQDLLRETSLRRAAKALGFDEQLFLNARLAEV